MSFPFPLFTSIIFVISCGTLLTIMLMKIISEHLLGFLRCTHILPGLLSMIIFIPNIQGLKKCVFLSFLRIGPKIWNSLPSDMTKFPKSTFRKKLRNTLSEVLLKSDDSLAITEIMHQLTKI